MLIVDDSEINRAVLANLFQAEYTSHSVSWAEILQLQKDCPPSGCGHAKSERHHSLIPKGIRPG